MKLFTALIAFILLCQAVFGLQNGDTLIVNAPSGLKVRDGPCTDYNLMTTLPHGVEVKFGGQMENGCGYTWYVN